MEVGKCAGRRHEGSIVAAVVGLVLQSARTRLQIAAERRLPTYPQHLAPRAHAIAEVSLIRTPIAQDQAVVAHAALKYTMHVPDIGPFGDFVGGVEIAKNAREINAGRNGRA